MPFLGIEIAKSGMNAARNQLNITAHNIANVSTPGYTRQQAIQVTKTPIHSLGIKDRLGNGVIGQGTDISTVVRVRNEFLDSEYRTYLSTTNSNYHLSLGYSHIESILNEPSDVSLSSNISSFWNSLSELGSKVTDMSARATFIQSSLSFTTALNNMGDKTAKLKSQYMQELETVVNKINLLTNEIYDLNKQISDLETVGNPANDLRDTRDNLIDELSKLVDIETYQNETGGVSVLAGGKLLVGENTKRQIKLTTDVNNDSYKVIWSDELDQFSIKGGHLHGALLTINNTIKDFENDLNSLVTAMTQKFNEVHQKGFDLNGNSGLEFFVSKDGGPLTINNITINPKILEDESLIALSSDATISGDNGNLNELLKVKDEKLLDTSGNSKLTVSEFYNYTVSKIGLNSKSYTQAYENANATLKNVATQKDSVSGVSMDEEAANLVMFQQVYNASAKVLQTVNEMLETLINII